MKPIKNLSLVVVCGIFLSYVLVSCSTSIYSGSSSIITKRKYMKGYCIDIKSRNGKIKKFVRNKTENEKLVIKDINENSYYDLPEIENNEELDLIASNENQIILPKQKIYKLTKIANLKSPITKSIKLIKRQKINLEKVEDYSGDGNKKINGLAIASFAISLISLFLTLLSALSGYGFGVLAFFGFILGLLAILLGIFGVRAVNKSGKRSWGKGFAITGIIIGSYAVLIGIVAMIFSGISFSLFF